MADEKKKTPVKPVKKEPVNYLKPTGIHLDMMRYRPNKFAYLLSVLAFVSLAIGFCVFYSSTELSTDTSKFNMLGITNPGPLLGIDIVLNIVLMLYMLLTAIRLKNYSVTFGYISIAFGVFQILRIFLLPLSLFNSGDMKIEIFSTIMSFYMFSGAMSILGGIFTIARGKALRDYLKTVTPIENEKVGK